MIAVNEQPPNIPQARSAAFLFRGQLLHLVLLALMLPTSWAFAAPALGDDRWLGLSDEQWYWTTVAVAVAHQFFVWAAWRVQLGWRLVTRWFGPADMAVYGAVFFVLLVARPLALIGLAIADAGSLALPRGLAIAMGVVLLIPGLYAFYSVARYFGFRRAMGGDHFRQQYREMPLVRDGAFRWTSNAMYALGFLTAWAIALLCGSLAALAAALFQHAYIWVHYHSTEQPDMQLLYARLDSPAHAP